MIKKLSSHLTPFKVFGFCCLLIAFAIAACKKNNTEQPSQQKELEEWFSQNKPHARASYFDDLKPKWETAYIIEPTSELTVYEMQVSNPKNIYQKLSDDTRKDSSHSRNNIRLLLFKDKVTGKILTGCYMSILNEGSASQDLKKIHYKQAGDLSGKIMFFNMQGTLENGWEYLDGKITMRINGSLEGYYYGSKKNQLKDLKNPAIGRMESRFEKLMTYTPETCAFPQPDWRTSCVGVDGYMECTTYLAGYFCVDQTPGGGGEGGYNPYPVNPGHGGGGSNPPTNPPVNKDIIDSLQGYPCAQGLLIDMPNLKNKIADSIRSVFVTTNSCTYYMRFTVQDSLKGTGTDGTTKSRTVPTNGLNFNDGYTFQAKIDMNPDILDYATKEYILVTMYHEALHAYMGAELDRLGATDFKEKYPDVNSAYITGPNGRIDLTKSIFVSEHSAMAKAFLDDLGKAIRSFNPNFTEERAKALAKAGIVNLTQAEKNINAAERDTRTNNYHGKKC